MKNISTLLTIATFTCLSGLAIASSAAIAGTPTTTTPPAAAAAAAATAASTAPTGVSGAPHENAALSKSKEAPSGSKAKAPTTAKHAAAAPTSHSADMKK